MESWSKLVSRDHEEKEGGQSRHAKHRREKSSLPRRHYYLNDHDKSAYFTYREAQCMAQIMRGKTIKASAQAIGLSPRTVEYYLKNMKAKFKCRTKSELMQLISLTDFMKLIHDF